MNSRFTLLAAVAALFGLVAFEPAARAQNRCAGKKITAAGKKTSCLLGLEAKEARRAIAKSSLKVQQCKDKFSQAFAKAEGKPPCSTTGDMSTIETKVEAFVDAMDDALAPGSNDPPIVNKCTSSKLKATGKKAKCLLTLKSKEASRGTAGDPLRVQLRVQRCKDKFSKSYAKAELSPTCLAPTGDTAAREADVDAFVDDVNTELTVTTTTSTTVTTAGPTTTTTTLGCNCCSGSFTQLSFTSTAPSATVTGNLKDPTGAPAAGNAQCAGCPNLTSGGLYYGAAGVGMPLPLVAPDMGQLFTGFATCNAATGAFTIAPRTAAQTGSQRNCTSASGSNPEYPTRPGCLVGPPLPAPNPGTPGTSKCTVLRVATSASGSGNCTDGSIAALNLPLSADMYLTGDLVGSIAGVQPCPVCTGLSGSETCKGGPNDGLPCTPGSGMLGAAYPTSHDCPPPDNDQPIGGGTGKFIGSLAISFNGTTGTVTAVSKDIANGVGTDRLFCGFCGISFGATFEGPPARPCTNNSQCTTPAFPSCKQRNSGAFGTGDVRTITENGSPAGFCLADGEPHAARAASVFCIPPSFNGTLDSVGDLPSLGAITLPGLVQAQ